jgi:hypothetical protein
MAADLVGYRSDCCWYCGKLRKRTSSLPQPRHTTMNTWRAMGAGPQAYRARIPKIKGARKMKRSRRLSAVAVLGLAIGAGAGAATAPTPASGAVTTSAARTDDGGAPPSVPLPDNTFSCPFADLSGDAFTDEVNADNIHIRNSPDGSWLYSIPKGHEFESSWSADGFQFGCISPVTGGQKWVLGWDVSNNHHVGWVGLDYLSP